MSNAYSPCPFCGGDDLHVSGGRFLDQVYCTQCDAYGPARTPGHSVAAWNRRAQPAAPAVCSSCDGTGKISGLPCAWCMQSAAPAVEDPDLTLVYMTGYSAGKADALGHSRRLNDNVRKQADAAPSVAPEPREQQTQKSINLLRSALLRIEHAQSIHTAHALAESALRKWRSQNGEGHENCDV